MGGSEGERLVSGDFYMILGVYRYTILSIQPYRTTLHPSHLLTFNPGNVPVPVSYPSLYILISTSCPDIFEFTPCVLLPISLAAA